MASRARRIQAEPAQSSTPRTEAPAGAKANLGNWSPWLAPPFSSRLRRLRRPHRLRLRWCRAGCWRCDGHGHLEAVSFNPRQEVVLLGILDLDLIEVAGLLQFGNEIGDGGDRRCIALHHEGI